MMNKNEKNSVRKYDKIAREYDSSFEGKFTARYRQKILELCDVPDEELQRMIERSYDLIKPKMRSKKNVQ